MTTIPKHIVINDRTEVIAVPYRYRGETRTRGRRLIYYDVDCLRCHWSATRSTIPNARIAAHEHSCPPPLTT